MTDTIPEYLRDLNPAQRLAATTIEGPLLVVAGAGTGKTKTVTHRIRHIIEQGIAPDSIVAVTFTNKAATEMRERVMALLDNRQKYAPDSVPVVATFHGLCVRMLRMHGREVGVPVGFTIWDRDDAIGGIKRAMEARSYDTKEWDPRMILNTISFWKNKGVNAKEFASRPAHGIKSDVIADVWTEYERITNKEGVCDFDDLLIKTVQMLETVPAVKSYYESRWHYIHVDEYQDTNHIQHKLIQLLVGERKNICAVGDADQTIYTWRGAAVQTMLHFEKDFPGAEVIILENNYRSTPTILAAAHDVIDKNVARIPKVLLPTTTEDFPITGYRAVDGADEARYVVGTLHTAIRNSPTPLTCAILFRTNFQSRLLEEACLELDVSYQIVGTRFFDRKEVKDVLAYLRVSLNRSLLSDLSRVMTFPKRGLGKVAIAHILSGESAETLSGKARESYGVLIGILDYIKEYAKTHQPAETLTYIVEKTGITQALAEDGTDGHDRLQNIQELVSFATRFSVEDNTKDEWGIEACDKMLEHCALVSDQDMIGEDAPVGSVVRLMTVHSAKGLEFDRVCIVGLEQGLFPSSRDGDTSDRDEEEERRLMYVAITRAKRHLVLSYAQIRTLYGRTTFQTPSEFLADIQQDLIVWDESSGIYSDAPTTHYLEW